MRRAQGPAPVCREPGFLLPEKFLDLRGFWGGPVLESFCIVWGGPGGVRSAEPKELRS